MFVVLVLGDFGLVTDEFFMKTNDVLKNKLIKVLKNNSVYNVVFEIGLKKGNSTQNTIIFVTLRQNSHTICVGYSLMFRRGTCMKPCFCLWFFYKPTARHMVFPNYICMCFFRGKVGVQMYLQICH